MARVTVEDCLEQVNNRFELILTATKRARKIANGAEPFVAWENDKPTVVALREIADGYVAIETTAVPGRVAEPETAEPADEAVAETGQGETSAGEDEV